MAKVTVEYYGVEGTGKNVTEAKRDAGQRIEEQKMEIDGITLLSPAHYAGHLQDLLDDLLEQYPGSDFRFVAEFFSNGDYRLTWNPLGTLVHGTQTVYVAPRLRLLVPGLSWIVRKLWGKPDLQGKSIRASVVLHPDSDTFDASLELVDQVATRLLHTRPVPERLRRAVCE